MILAYLTCFMAFFPTEDLVMEQMVEIRRHLHRYPELSNREFKTRDYLKLKLKDAGFTVIEEMAKTGLRVVHDTGKPGPVVAFRADIDALPVTERTGLEFSSEHEGVMHACGHDVHTAILFGTALAIRADDSLKGKYVFIFQPAEEGPPPGEEGGASLMMREGVLENPKPDVIFGLHCMGYLRVGQVGYREGGIMARADRFQITIKGKQAHGSAPHQGIDPVFVASEVVTAAQSIVSRRVDSRDPVVISFGEFNAGQRFNIIPETATLTGTIRTLSPETGDRIPLLLDELLGGITKAHGASYSFRNETMCPSTQNHAEWTRKAVAILQEQGMEMVNVMPMLAAEDFAYYGEEIPGVYFFLGVCETDSCSNIHSPEFSPSEKAMPEGLRAFLSLAKAISEGAAP